MYIGADMEANSKGCCSDAAIKAGRKENKRLDANHILQSV